MTERHLILVGFLTWIIIGIPQAVIASGDGKLLPWLITYVAFIALFGICTRDRSAGRRELLLIALQSAVAMLCIALQPDGFMPILLVIVAGELGHLRIPAALIWITVQSILLGILISGQTHSELFQTLAYFAFQLFGVLTARIAHEERQAKLSLAEANAELRVATGLLDLSSRSEERLRIARDLHDLIGHHLTALSLNLEVASHLAEGQAKEQIAKSQSLTKLLLSDVRDVVSRLREDEPIDLGAALRSIRDAVPSPAIHVEGDGSAHPAVAQTALRVVQEIVTNAVRHSGARTLRLSVQRDDGALAIDARDDGSGTDRIEFGNGLRGMRERVQQAGGTMEVASMRGRGFEVHVRLPL